MKLHGESVMEANSQSSSIGKRIRLMLTLRFGEHQINIGSSTVKFGIKGGELRLKLNNSKILLETLGLTPAFQTTFDVDRQAEKGIENETGGSFGVKMGVEGKRKETSKAVNRFKEVTYKVYAKGTEEKPIWVFQIDTNEKVLQGILKAETLGNLQIHSIPCQIVAEFHIRSEKDIHSIKIAESPITKFLDNNKNKMIGVYTRKKIPSWLEIQQKLKNSYISRAELFYE